MQQIVTAVLVRKRVPDVPDSVPAASIIRRCFTFEPSERPTAAELTEALSPEAAALPELAADVTREFAREFQLVAEELRRTTEDNRALQQQVQTERSARQRAVEALLARTGANAAQLTEQEQRLLALEREIQAERAAKAEVEAIGAQMHRRVVELEETLARRNAESTA